jgi:hypothetical protein
MIEQSEWPDAPLAEAVFLTALADLELTYRQTPFRSERDVVSWLHDRVCALAPVGLTVRTDCPLLGKRPDLVLFVGERALLAAELIYEPCPSRSEAGVTGPLPGFWSEVTQDLERTEQYVAEGAASIGWAVCIDEGGRHAGRTWAPHSVVHKWETGYRTEVTMTRWPINGGGPTSTPQVGAVSSGPLDRKRWVSAPPLRGI